MNEPIHILVYMKRQLGCGRGAPNRLGDFVELSLIQPMGHGFGQRWLFDLSRKRHDIVIWLFSVIRHRNVCLPPSLDARIKVASSYEQSEIQTATPYMKWLLSQYRYAFEADPAHSYYLPWNDATPVFRQIISGVEFEDIEPEVMPFSVFSSTMLRFQTPRRIDAENGVLLDNFAQELLNMPGGFISYRRKDAPVLAMQTAARSYLHGVAPWWDQWGMPRKVAEEDATLSSQAMDKALEIAIGRSEYAMTLHTHDYASDRSRWTKIEYDRIKCASSEGKIKHVSIKVQNKLLNEIEDSKEFIDHELQNVGLKTVNFGMVPTVDYK